jgi:exonuclease III
MSQPAAHDRNTRATRQSTAARNGKRPLPEGYQAREDRKQEIKDANGPRRAAPTQPSRAAPPLIPIMHTQGGQGPPRGGRTYHYATVNVRTLRIRNDGHRKFEEDGNYALAEQWVVEMELVGCGLFAVQECRIPGQADTTFGGYRAFFSGAKEKRQHGVGLFIRQDWITGSIDLQPISERLLWINGTFHGTKRTIVVVYAPTEVADDNAKDDMYQSLSTELAIIKARYGDNIIIMGDFNARVGMNAGFEHSDGDFLGPYGLPQRDNTNGAILRAFCSTNSFKIADTFFAEEHGDYDTWRHSSSDGFNAALDHILVHDSIWHTVTQCGVRDPADGLPATDHRVVHLEILGPKIAIQTAVEKRQKRRLERPIPAPEQHRHMDRTRMNKRVLATARSKDGNAENGLLATIIEEAARKHSDAQSSHQGPPDNQTDTRAMTTLLEIFSASLDAGRTTMWPDGVPSDKQKRVGSYMHREPITKTLLAAKHAAWLQLRAVLRTGRTPPQQIQLATARYKKAQRKAQRQVRKTRQEHYSSIGSRIQTAHDARDAKLVHQLAQRWPLFPDSARVPGAPR